MYIDILKNDKEETGNHYYMKCVNLECITLYVEENNNSIYYVYKRIYECETLIFDLLKVKQCFKMNDKQTISNQSKFERRIKETEDKVKYWIKWKL